MSEQPKGEASSAPLGTPPDAFRSQVAAIVNGYYNDLRPRHAEDALRAIAEALGKPMEDTQALASSLVPEPPPADRQGWQPIETAPTHAGVIVWWPAYSPRPTSAIKQADGRWVADPGASPEEGPTHWMPFPEPPGLAAESRPAAGRPLEETKGKNNARGVGVPGSPHGDLPRRNDGDK